MHLVKSILRVSLLTSSQNPADKFHTLIPTLRRLRSVLIIVDIVGDIQLLLALRGKQRRRVEDELGSTRSGLAWCRQPKALPVPRFLNQAFNSGSVIAKEVAMIARSVLRCSATRRLQVCGPRMIQAKPRRFSSSAPHGTNANSSSTASMLGAFTNELDRIAPRFEIQGEQIQILRTPSEFYDTLKVGTLL